MEQKKQEIGNTYFIIIGVFAAAAILFGVVLNGYMPLALVCLAVAVVTAVYYLLRRLAPKHPKGTKIVNRIVSYAVVLALMLFAITEGAILASGQEVSTSGIGEQTAEEALDEIQYYIVLGAGLEGTEPSQTLRDRLEQAKICLEQHPDAICIVTGCQGKNEVISEAECMRLWLEGQGIAPERIVKEEQARNTDGNIRFSYEIVRQLSGSGNEPVAIITNEFHILRTKMIAAENGIACVAIPARTSYQLMRVNQFVREAFALWNQLLFR